MLRTALRDEMPSCR